MWAVKRLKKEFVRNCFPALHSQCFLLLFGAKDADSKLVNQRMTGCQFRGLLHLKPHQVGHVAVIPAGETARCFRLLEDWFVLGEEIVQGGAVNVCALEDR